MSTTNTRKAQIPMLRSSMARRAAVMAVAAGALVLGPSTTALAQSPTATTARAKAGPVMFFNIPSTAKISGTYKGAIKPAVVPPPVLLCLPVTPPSPVPGCVPPAPPAGEPWPGNMAYFGGHIQVAPKEYLVFYGWDQPGAFATGACPKISTAPGAGVNFPVCDPDGAGARIYDFVNQMGGSTWAGVQTQYYQTNADGSQTNITNPVNQLGGVWIDDHSVPNFDPTKTGTPQLNDVMTVLGTEAGAAVKHFGLTAAVLHDANIIVIQPAKVSDPAASSQGYCAWHDFTEPTVENGVYDHVQSGISFTDMPYILNQGGACGQGVEGGNLDGETIVLGHEIEETVTDPGAEDVINGQNLGGWYDNEAYENGDKCAWVGTNPVWELTGAGPTTIPNFPGAVGTMTGNQGGTFPVQALWSDNALGGVGYCAGAGTDLPSAPGSGTVPEAPLALLVPLLGLGTAGSIVMVRRRRRSRMAGIG